MEGYVMRMHIKKIWQKDNYHFGVLWGDGKEMEYALADLQEGCPCARCQTTRESGKIVQKNEDVTAVTIESVGLYALRIHFKEGCSLGIYDFDSLYAMDKK